MGLKICVCCKRTSEPAARMLHRRVPAGWNSLAIGATGKLRHHSINLNYRRNMVAANGRHKPVGDA